MSFEGPLIIAANHPDSFLDAIVLASLFKNPIHSLARGDAFNGKFITKILRSLNMLPVYRVSEGVENLEHNYTTFEACQDIFKKKSIVLIFSEGRCVNEWHLRPLKKGTARLALTAWQQNIPLGVLPLGINYSNFRKISKKLFLNFGKIITKETISNDIYGGKSINEFNKALNEQLQKLVFEIDENDKEKKDALFQIHQSFLLRTFFFIPSLLGFIIHLPLCYPIHLLIKKKAQDHYDSIMVGLLFLIYPVYVILITMFILLLTKNIFALLLILLVPFTGYSYIKMRKD